MFRLIGPRVCHELRQPRVLLVLPGPWEASRALRARVPERRPGVSRARPLYPRVWPPFPESFRKEFFDMSLHGMCDTARRGFSERGSSHIHVAPRPGGTLETRQGLESRVLEAGVGLL